MKTESILFIAYSGPCPPRDGKKQRTYALLQALSSQYQVDFLIINNQLDFRFAQEQYRFDSVRFLHFTTTTSTWDRMKHKIGFVFHNSKELKDFITSLSIEKDYAFVFTRYIQPVFNIHVNKKIIADIDDDFKEVFKTRISNEKRWNRKLRLWQIFQFNRSIYQRLIERIYLPIVVKKEAEIPNAFLLPNLPFQLILKGESQFKSCGAKVLLYVGKLTYTPNAQGLIWFLMEVWPHLVQQNPEIKMILISNENPKNSKLIDLIESEPKIQLKINVEDLDTYYNGCGLVIAPVFEGGGSNIKIAEALWMGRPVITTEFGISGYESFRTTSLLKVGDSPAFWIKEVFEILFDKEKLVSIQKICFEVSRQTFSFEKWKDSLLEEIKTRI